MTYAAETETVNPPMKFEPGDLVDVRISRRPNRWGRVLNYRQDGLVSVQLWSAHLGRFAVGNHTYAEEFLSKIPDSEVPTPQPIVIRMGRYTPTQVLIARDRVAQIIAPMHATMHHDSAERLIRAGLIHMDAALEAKP